MESRTGSTSLPESSMIKRSKPEHRVPSVPLEQNPTFQELKEALSKLSPDRLDAFNEWLEDETDRESTEQ